MKSSENIAFWLWLREKIAGRSVTKSNKNRADPKKLQKILRNFYSVTHVLYNFAMKNCEKIMRACVNLAWENQTLALPNPAVCACIARDGEILSIAAHKKSGTSHAEILAIKAAFEKNFPQNHEISTLDPKNLHEFLAKNHQNIFKNCDIFVTLEPCTQTGKTPPCADLLAILGVKNVFFGAKDFSKNGGGADFLRKRGIFTRQILKNECDELILPFVALQKKGNFNLFKLALRLDGTHKNGQISSKNAQIFTHNQRAIAQNIVISGRTMRNDDPMLDFRFADNFYKNSRKNPPNAMVLSRNLEISQNYKILKNAQKIHRNVTFCNKIQDLPRGFNIIEGGFALFLALKKQIDMALFHIKMPENFHENPLDFLLENNILTRLDPKNYGHVTFCNTFLEKIAQKNENLQENFTNFMETTQNLRLLHATNIDNTALLWIK